jgi:hypothetical protein
MILRRSSRIYLINSFGVKLSSGQYKHGEENTALVPSSWYLKIKNFNQEKMLSKLSNIPILD